MSSVAFRTAAHERPVEADESGRKNSKLENNPDDFFSDFAALLSAPLQLDSQESQSFESSFFALCPGCGLESTHALVSKGFLRKDEYSCITCSQRTSKCIQFSICRGVTKSNFLWDDAHCESCEKKIQMVGNGETTFGIFVQNFKEQSAIVEGKENEPDTSVRNSELHALTDSGSDVGVKLKNDIEPSSNTVSDHAEPDLLASSSEIEQTISPQTLNSSPNDNSNSNIGVLPIESDEPWIAVRDVVLNWPGPERADVDLYRHLCAHKAWVNRWVVSCSGDEAWAVRRILAHLKWRQQYGLDTIMDEVLIMSCS
jgi:hypothetical protein